MNLLVRISLRNLFRQKRRNLLLGSAIACGAMILVLAHAFAHGISEVLFNRIVKYVSGHVSISFTQGGNLYRQVFYDGERIMRIARENVQGLTGIEESIGMFGRAIGNGRAENVILVGIDLSAYTTPEEEAEAASNFRMIEGAFEDIADSSVENAVVIAEQKARYLNVRRGDILRLRVRDIRGQDVAARATVVGIFTPASIFMSAPIFLELRNLKRILGYRPHEIGQVWMTIRDPRRNAKREADRLHSLLKPLIAVIPGTASHGGNDAPVILVAAKQDSVSESLVEQALPLVQGEPQITWGKDGVAAGEGLAQALRVGTGDTVTIKYRGKYRTGDTTVSFVLRGVFRDSVLGTHVIVMNERDFYRLYYDNWPAPADDPRLIPTLSQHPVAPALGTEWILLDRSASTTDLQERYKEVVRKKWRAVTVDVRSMYESASMVLSLEYALNLITLSAVLVLFVVILIGVVNTLRMTIRERTREIGTMRAIGMQRRDVQATFLLETFFLALFGSVAGTVAGFIAMWGLSRVHIEAGGNPLGMLLVNNRLHFAPTTTGVLGYVGLILVISVVTAYFPSRRAARLSAAEALRHYE